MTQKTGVLPLPEIPGKGALCMPTIEIRFSERDTLPELMERTAQELDITVEQLIKRFICTGMQEYDDTTGPTIPGKTLDDFLVKNGVLKESK